MCSKVWEPLPLMSWDLEGSYAHHYTTNAAQAGICTFEASTLPPLEATCNESNLSPT